MKIGIISNSFKPYSTRRLAQEAGKKAVKVFPKDMFLTITKELHGVTKKIPLTKLSVVIPRLGTTNWEFGLLSVKHLENMGIPLVNNYRACITCKNKYLTNLALKRKKVPQPEAAICLSSKDMMKFVAKHHKPVVLKLLAGSLGEGISKIQTKNEAEEWLDTFKRLNQALYIQEYIDHGGVDYRLIVIDGKVIFSYKRIAKKGAWKTNISLGSSCVVAKPNKQMKEIALKAADATKCDVSGVDIVINPEGKMFVIEVNSFPFFKAPETRLKQNIAKQIIQFAKKQAKR